MQASGACDDLLKAAGAGDLRATIQTIQQMLAQALHVAVLAPAEGSSVHVTRFLCNLLSCSKTSLEYRKLLASCELNCRWGGDTSLLAAVRAGRHDTLAVLLAAKVGGDVNAVNSRTGGTALHVAANKGFTNITVQILSQPSIDLNAKTPEGNTALMLASWKGHTEIVAALLAAGSTTASATKGGAGGERGGAIDPRGSRGRRRTPSTSATSPALSLSKKLRQIDIDAVNGANQSALVVAACHNHQVVVAMLLDRGANVNTVDAEGYTAYNYSSTFVGFPPTLLARLQPAASLSVDLNDSAGIAPLSPSHEQAGVAPQSQSTPRSKPSSPRRVLPKVHASSPLRPKNEKGRKSIMRKIDFAPSPFASALSAPSPGGASASGGGGTVATRVTTGTAQSLSDVGNAKGNADAEVVAAGGNDAANSMHNSDKRRKELVLTKFPVRRRRTISNPVANTAAITAAVAAASAASASAPDTVTRVSEGTGVQGKSITITKLEHESTGLELQTIAGSTSILRVVADSPAARAGAVEGDAVIAVDGTDVTALAHAEVTGMLAGTSESSFTLTTLTPSYFNLV